MGPVGSALRTEPQATEADRHPVRTAQARVRSAAMPLTLVATGGTIASTRGPDGTVTATRSGSDLLQLLPSQHDVHVIDLPVPGSWNMSGEHALRVALAVRDALRSGSGGVVVTHGTDVLEETVFLTDLVARAEAERGAIVFTAAMRHGSEFGSDGPRNLDDALRVAAEPDATGRGALVCLNGELHHARWVVKTHATGICAFESPGRAPVGTVDEYRVRFTAASPAPAPEPPAEPHLDLHVPIVYSHWDSDPELVPWLLDRGADGIVVEAGGAGNVNAGLLRGIDVALDRGVPVVVASRCLMGEVTPTYGGDGGFATLHRKGVIGAGGLTAGKARLALQLVLGAGGGARTIRSYFDALVDGA